MGDGLEIGVDVFGHDFIGDSGFEISNACGGGISLGERSELTVDFDFQGDVAVSVALFRGEKRDRWIVLFAGGHDHA